MVGEHALDPTFAPVPFLRDGFFRKPRLPRTLPRHTNGVICLKVQHESYMFRLDPDISKQR